MGMCKIGHHDTILVVAYDQILVVVTEASICESALIASLLRAPVRIDRVGIGVLTCIRLDGNRVSMMLVASAMTGQWQW